MSGTDADPILIKATSKRNGITTIILGVGGILFSMLWLSFAPDWLFLAGVFLTSASIVVLLIGWFKLREPDHSIAISPASIVYHHRLGNWSMDWDNVQRVGCPRVRRGLEHIDLEVVGFRLKDYGEFLHGISPRLATHVLMEQRPLLLQKTDDSCSSGACYSENFLDDKHFKLADGKHLTGVKAMLANRMTQLREKLGYDVFVTAGDLDRPAQEFVTLMRELQQSRHTVEPTDTDR